MKVAPQPTLNLSCTPYITDTGSEISYFSDNDLSLLQLRPGGNDSKNRSKCFRDNKKLPLCFWSRLWLPY